MLELLKKTGIFLSFVTTLIFSISHVDGSACLGCAGLDELNFDKVIARFPYSIVKFDIAYPFGEKHENFALFAKSALKKTDDLLVATVGIKDYGENENKALGDRFNIKEKYYPAIFLFKGDSNNYMQMPSHIDVTVAGLEKFITDNTPIFLGKAGCLKAFNELSKNYANFSAKDQLEVIATAKQLAKMLTKVKEQAQAKIYIIFMQKINENGYDFVEEETKRLLRLKGGKVSDAKKSELKQKLNILETFRVSKLTKESNEEL